MGDESGPTAFVLSGGASLAALQVGMLHALYARGIAPDLIVATSAGAFNGAFIASRPACVETAEELAEIWRSLHRSDVFPLNPLSGLLGLAGVRGHLVPDGALRRLIGEHYEDGWLEELPIPTHLIATDIQTGEEVRLSEGPVADAVMASAAIPGVLPSVEWRGRTLVDGGVANNTPISHAIELGARRIYVLAAGNSCELQNPPRGAVEVVVQALNLLVQRRLSVDIELLERSAELIVLPQPCPLLVQPTDFSQANELMERGLAEARRFLLARAQLAEADEPGADGRPERRGRVGMARRRHSRLDAAPTAPLY
jgi:NTE family protein